MQSLGRPVETQRWLLGVFKKWTQFHGPPQLTHKQGQECQPHRHTEGRKSKNICKIIRNHCLGTKIAWTKSGINLLKWCWNISHGFFFFSKKFNQLVALKENSVTDQKCGLSLSEEITSSMKLFLSDREICRRYSCFGILKVAHVSTNDSHSLGA